MNPSELSVRAAPLRPVTSGAPRVLAGGRISRVDELRAQARKPGEASFFYADHHFQYDAVKVLPGEYFVSSEDVLIMTVLGSCIAACVWDGKARVGGMNHFMLPEGEDGSGRYGSYAMELLLNEMIKMGARRETMQAKVFGGGAVMAGFTTMNVGERNTKFVLDYLATERIPVVSHAPHRPEPAVHRAVTDRVVPAHAPHGVPQHRILPCHCRVRHSGTHCAGDGGYGQQSRR